MSNALQTGRWSVLISLLTGQEIYIENIASLSYERTADQLIGTFSMVILDPNGELIPEREISPIGVALRPENQARIRIFYGDEIRFTGFTVNRKYDLIRKRLTISGTDNASKLGTPEQFSQTPESFIGMVQSFCAETGVLLNVASDAYDYKLLTAISSDNDSRAAIIRRYNMDTNLIFIDKYGTLQVRKNYSPLEFTHNHLFSTEGKGTYPLVDVEVNDTRTDLIDEIWFQINGSDTAPFKIRIDQVYPQLIRNPTGVIKILKVDNTSVRELKPPTDALPIGNPERPAYAFELAEQIFKFNLYNQTQLSRLVTGFGFTGDIGDIVKVTIPDVNFEFKFVISTIKVTADSRGFGSMELASQLRGFGEISTQKIEDLIAKNRRRFSQKMATLMGFTKRTGEDSSSGDIPPNSGLTISSTIIDPSTGSVPDEINGRCTVRIDADGSIVPDLLPSTVVDNNILDTQLSRGIITRLQYDQIKKFRGQLIERDFTVNNRVLVLDNMFVVPVAVTESGIGSLSAGPSREVAIDEEVTFTDAYVTGLSKTISWDFGDGTFQGFATAQDGKTTYAASGVYIATLKVEWLNGVVSTSETIVTVKQRYATTAPTMVQSVSVMHLPGVWSVNV